MDLYEIDLSDIEPGAWVKIPCRRTVEVSEGLLLASDDLARYRAAQFAAYVKQWWRDDRPLLSTYRQLDEWTGAAILDRAHKHYEEHIPVRQHVDLRLNRDSADVVARALEGAEADGDELSFLGGVAAQLRAFVAEGAEGKA